MRRGPPSADAVWRGATAATSSRAYSAVFTVGTMMPLAPRSRIRLIVAVPSMPSVGQFRRREDGVCGLCGSVPGDGLASERFGHKPAGVLYGGDEIVLSIEESGGGY